MIFVGDCKLGLIELDAKSVNCCVTSHPYYGLRDYGNDGQIGLEETPELYVAKLVELFREVRRVLRDDGTLWLNLGDSYAGSGKGSNPDGTIHPACLNGKQGTHKGTIEGIKKPQKAKEINLKPKDLIGIPWMVAFALRADGWYLRQDIIWHKPNPMPESVTDRCTKAHEYIFLLSKSQQYWYDADAIAEKSIWAETDKRFVTGPSDGIKTKDGTYAMQSCGAYNKSGYANKRSVWTVTTKPFSEAHFATFPEDLIIPCIKAGCHVGGIVLDPFMGAGTTGLVARKLGRDYVGFELNAEYVRIAEQRIIDAMGVGIDDVGKLNSKSLNLQMSMF
jgi:DNA modification methylase